MVKMTCISLFSARLADDAFRYTISVGRFASTLVFTLRSWQDGKQVNFVSFKADEMEMFLANTSDDGVLDTNTFALSNHRSLALSLRSPVVWITQQKKKKSLNIYRKLCFNLALLPEIRGAITVALHLYDLVNIVDTDEKDRLSHRLSHLTVAAFIKRALDLAPCPQCESGIHPISEHECCVEVEKFGQPTKKLYVEAVGKVEMEDLKYGLNHVLSCCNLNDVGFLEKDEESMMYDSTVDVVMGNIEALDCKYAVIVSLLLNELN